MNSQYFFNVPRIFFKKPLKEKNLDIFLTIKNIKISMKHNLIKKMNCHTVKYFEIVITKIIFSRKYFLINAMDSIFILKPNKFFIILTQNYDAFIFQSICPD